MSAAPAYSYQYPERAPERAPRVRVVPGRGTRTSIETLAPSVIFLAKTVAVVLVVLTLLCFVRIGLASASVTTSLQSQEIAAKIDGARSSGSELEVAQSSLSNPTRVKQAAAGLGMESPESVDTITLDRDVVATDAQGNLSLSQSVAIAAQI